MNIKIKYPGKNGIIRIENSADIKEVMIKENLVDADKRKVVIGFMNEESSGIIELGYPEFDRLMKSARDNTKLVKGMKVIRG